MAKSPHADRGGLDRDRERAGLADLFAVDLERARLGEGDVERLRAAVVDRSVLVTSSDLVISRLRPLSHIIVFSVPIHSASPSALSTR